MDYNRPYVWVWSRVYILQSAEGKQKNIYKENRNAYW